MKDSGIEWIGEIPKDWEICRVKDHYSIHTGFTPDTTNFLYYDDEGYDWANISDITDTNIVYDTKNKISELYIQTHHPIVIPKGSLLYSFKLSVGQTAYAGKDLYTNEAIASFWPQNNINLHFLRYSSSLIIDNAQTNIYNARILNKQLIGNARIVFPPILEQSKIVDFLDNKCSDIDALTSDIKSQIDMLEQYKRSVITEAVTKGLNPDVEMKDSGVEWIGEIPASWNVHPVYYYFGERKNKNSLGAEANLLSLSYGKIIQKDINSNGGLLPESFNTYNIVEPGDIIIRPTDLQNDKRSLRTGLVTEHGIITSAYIDLKAIKPVNTAYYHYLLHAFDVMKVFYNMGNGVRQGLNFSEFSKLMVFEPSRDEQDAIANYLDSKCSDIDAVISDKQAQLDTLAGYKKSLIYEYVTGKKEVPTS